MIFFFFFLGGVSFVFERCSEDICTFLFFILDTLSFCIPVLWPFIDNIHCTFISYIYIYMMMMYVVIHLSLHVCVCVCFSLSLFKHMFLYVCNPLFLFHTKIPWWVLFQVFQKDRLSKSIMSWTFFLQSFSRVCVRIRFYCTQQVIMSLVIYDFSHT